MTPTTKTQPAEGRARKADAHATLEARRETYVIRARRALLSRLLVAPEVTADDVRDVVELPPEINPVCLGVVPGILARACIIERVGYVESRRPDAHARPVSVWRLIDRNAAVHWLQAHPDQPDPMPTTEPTLFDTETKRTPDGATSGANPIAKGLI